MHLQSTRQLLFRVAETVQNDKNLALSGWSVKGKRPAFSLKITKAGIIFRQKFVCAEMCLFISGDVCP